MFGIDFSEVLVIFGIALVVLGPEKLPKLAATIGRWIGRARAMARQFKDQLEQETSALQRGVDLGPEFHGHPSKSATPSIRPVAPAGATPTPAPDASTVQPAAADTGSGASPAVTDLTARTGSEALSTAVPEDFGLADTYPEALNRPDPVGADPDHSALHPINGNGAAPDSHAAGGTPAPTASLPEPHQQVFWPPDGPP